MASIKNYFLNLNLFQTENPEQNHINRISTRVYLIVLITILFSLFLHFWLSSQTVIITIDKPSITDFQKLPSDSYCPCSQISIVYNKLITLETTFHQICSSQFISDRWIQTINYGSLSSYLHDGDFRIMGSTQFQAISGFCQLSKETISQSIVSFGKKFLISSQISSENIFQSQINSIIDQFQLTVPNNFQTQLQLLNQIIFQSQFISGFQTNQYFQYYINNNISFIILTIQEYQPDNNTIVCNCFSNINCRTLAKIYSAVGGTIQMTIPGFFSGCLPINTMLASTFECFYNQTCIDKLLSYFPTNQKFQSMSTDQPTQYKLNINIKSIIDQLMVENWTRTISYYNYYTECAPISCTYSIRKTNSFIFATTKLIGLLGGLTLILSFIIPQIINFLMKRGQPSNTLPTVQISIFDRLTQMKLFLKKFLLSLNFFSTKETNENQIHHQRIATRIYLILISISIAIIACYILISKTTHYKIISQLNENQYKELEEIYSNKLTCPCTSISILYSNFINIQPEYHQICSSDLIQTDWINYVSKLEPKTYYSLDYRFNAVSQFIALEMFCQQSKQTISEALRVFLQTQFVNTNLLPPLLFQSQINLFIQTWQSVTINDFLRTMQIIRTTNNGNYLLGAFLNVEFSVNSLTRKTTMNPKIYSNCSCIFSQSCESLMAIYETSIKYPVFQIPNFFVGCYLIESLLISTLECFYNRSCMLEIDKYMADSRGILFNFSSLNSNLNLPNETIGSIVDKLMVNSWISNISYSSYYNSCVPSTCTIEYIDSNDVLFVLTTILSIFGGLSLGFRMILIISLKLIDKFTIGIRNINLRKYFIYQNKHQLINQLQFITVLATLYILYILSAFTLQIETIKIVNPSLNIYNDLSKDFSDNLQCYCSEISIKYETFVRIKPEFHQICSSIFISNQWIYYLYGQGNLTNRYYSIDFYYSAFAQFQLLSSFCQLSKETVEYTLYELTRSNFINTRLLSQNLLKENIEKIINEFLLTMPEIFLSTLSLIREIIGANRIMNTIGTSWIISSPGIIYDDLKAYPIPNYYSDCNCALSSKCVQSSRGMLAGCYPLEALFQATFQCLYEQSCIDSTNQFQALNISLAKNSRFNINATIESVVNQLMVEQYLSNISYENYFSQCAPSYCIYYNTENIKIIEGITYLIALYGGLMIICRLFAVLIAQILWYRTTIVEPISN